MRGEQAMKLKADDMLKVTTRVSLVSHQQYAEMAYISTPFSDSR